MSKHTITYLELPSSSVPALKDFYGKAFGWTFEDFGPDYAAFHGAGLEGGFNASNEGRTKAPLPVVQTVDIDAMERAVAEAGGTISVPTFAYPGGRRFHFTDPDGNELAVMQPDA